MCGVFGYVSQNGNGPDLSLLRKIAINTETRGRHAHGLAWVDVDGRLHRYKATGPISGDLDCLRLVEKAQIVIGHCRYATHGDYRDQENNHPHPSDGGWLVHNGVIGNYDSLLRTERLTTTSGCDSEAIGLLIESSRGSLLERTRRAINLTTGPLAVLGLWTRPRRLIIARRGNPLSIGWDVYHNVYLASLPDALPEAKRMADNSIRTWSMREGAIFETREELESWPSHANRNDCNLFRKSRETVTSSSGSR